MKKYLRTIGEMLLLALLAGLLPIAIILITRQVFDDEKVQYGIIGYYCAVHNDLARWVWKRLGIEKPQGTNAPQPRKDSTPENKDLDTEEFMAVFRRSARWVHFGIVCSILGFVTAVTALIVSLR